MVLVSLRIGPVAQRCGKVWPYLNLCFPCSLWLGCFFREICPCPGVQLGLHAAHEELALGKGSELP